MELELKLTVDEVNVVLHHLGNLPTSSGVWPLAVKIRDQAQAQLPEEVVAPEQDEA